MRRYETATPAMIPLASVINVCRSLFHANARPSPPRLHSVIDYWAARDPNRGKKFTILLLLLLASNPSIVVQKREERFVVAYPCFQWDKDGEIGGGGGGGSVNVAYKFVGMVDLGLYFRSLSKPSEVGSGKRVRRSIPQLRFTMDGKRETFPIGAYPPRYVCVCMSSNGLQPRTQELIIEKHTFAYITRYNAEMNIPGSLRRIEILSCVHVKLY